MIDLMMPQSAPANLLAVEFDFAAASAAEQALRSAASAVGSAASARAAAAGRAEQNWTGGQRSAFDSTEDTLSGDASTLVSALTAAAEKLHTEAAAAKAENARRATALAHWQHDLAQARAKYVEAQRAAASGRG